MKKNFLFFMIGFGWMIQTSVKAYPMDRSLYAGGDGTENNPYLIETPEQLNQLSIDTNEGNIDTTGKYFKLIADIDLATFDTDQNPDNGNWIPIGFSLNPSEEKSFKGVFLGNHHTISNIILLNEHTHTGLFGLVSGGTIKDLTLEDFIVQGTDRVGTLAGEIEKNSFITNVHTNGVVEGTGNRVGGLAGYIKESDLTNSGSRGIVRGVTTVGGIAGLSYLNGTTENLYSSTQVFGETQVGGLFGKHSSSTLRNIRATGEVTGTKDVGGLIGYISDAVLKQSISKATVYGEQAGRFVGFKASNAIIAHSYVDREKSPELPIVFRDENPDRTDVTELDHDQMSGEAGKENMPDINFDEGWTMDSKGDWVLDGELSSPTLKPSPTPNAELVVKGVIEPTLVSLTVPTTPLTFIINPNLELNQQFIAPTFEIFNTSNAPLSLEIRRFKQLTTAFKDVLPNKYVDWSNLTQAQSKDFALALIPQSGEGWIDLSEGPRYVAQLENEFLGVIKPQSHVSFEFEANHGSSFKESFQLTYQLSFIFDLKQ